MNENVIEIFNMKILDNFYDEIQGERGTKKLGKVSEVRCIDVDY